MVQVPGVMVEIVVDEGGDATNKQKWRSFKRYNSASLAAPLTLQRKPRHVLAPLLTSSTRQSCWYALACDGLRLYNHLGIYGTHRAGLSVVGRSH